MIATSRDMVKCTGCGHEHYRDVRRAFFVRCPDCGGQEFDVFRLYRLAEPDGHAASLSPLPSRPLIGARSS